MAVKKEKKKRAKKTDDEEEISDLTSDEPSEREESLTPELENEGKREEAEDDEDKDFYGNKKKNDES